MTLKYESELLYELMKRDGDDTPSDVLPYESELKEKYLNQVVGAYPKLQDYRPEWLNYNLYHHLPSDFPVETVSNVTNATFQNVVPYAYKSAILKGKTLVNLLPRNPVTSSSFVIKIGSNISVKSNTIYTVITPPNTSCGIYPYKGEKFPIKTYTVGCYTFNTLDNYAIDVYVRPKDTSTSTEFIDDNYFEVMIIEGDYTNEDIPYFEGIQSVRMPVLTTTGKNLFNNEFTTISNYDNQTYSRVNVNKIIGKNGNFTISVLEELNSKGKIWFNLYINGTEKFNLITNGATANKKYTFLLNEQNQVEFGVYSEGISKQQALENIKNNFKIQLEEGTTATSYEPYKSNILTVNEDVTLRSNGSVCDELDLLTGKLTQRIDEDGEVLTQEVVKTVDLTCINEQGENVNFMPIEGTMHVSASSQTITPLLEMSVPVEAITQNLNSFANMKEE